MWGFVFHFLEETGDVKRPLTRVLLTPPPSVLPSRTRKENKVLDHDFQSLYPGIA